MPLSAHEVSGKERTLKEVSSWPNALSVAVHHQQKARANRHLLELSLGLDMGISEYGSVPSEFQRMPVLSISNDFFL